MPFNGNVFTPVSGAESAAPGQVLSSTVWNAIFTDLASALTTVMTQTNTIPTFANVLSANGSFNIWQRGAGSTASFAVPASTTQYTADRWYITTGANQASTVAAATSFDSAAAPAHACKVQRNAAQTGITSITFGYPLTTDEVVNLNGQRVSFSGLAKAGANWSPTSGTLTINLYVGTGTPQKRGGGFAGETNPLSISVNLAAGTTNSAISGTSTGTVATTSTQGELQVTWTPVGTAGGDDSITFDGFCLVPGTIVTSFENLPFDYCLKQCKRFFRKSFPYNTPPSFGAGIIGCLSAISAASSQIGFYVQFESIEMYTTATMTTWHPTANSNGWLNNTSGVSVTSTLDVASQSAKGIGIFTAANVTAANQVLYIHYSADCGL